MIGVFLLLAVASNSFTALPSTLRVQKPVSNFLFFSEDRSDERAEKDELERLQQVVQEASELSVAADNRVGELNQRIQYLENEISRKQEALQSKSDEWSLDKTNLVARVAELTNILNRQESETRNQKSQRETQLQQELDILRKNLDETKDELELSVQASKEMQHRLLEAEDRLEYEQMQFFKEKKELNTRIEEERNKLNDLAREFQKEQTKYAAERDELIGKIDAALSKLQATETQMAREQRQAQEQKLRLEAQIQTLKSNLQVARERLEMETKQFTRERREMREEIAQQSSRLVETEDALRTLEQEFRQTKRELEAKIASERERVSKLTSQLDRETERFIKEKEELKSQLTTERSKLSEVQALLEEESKRFDKEKADLENQVKEGERIRKLKARQMNERYTEIRRELTERLEAVKREARSEENRLMKKYESRLNGVYENVKRLQEELAEAEMRYQNVTLQLEDMAAQRDRVIHELDVKERQYLQTVSVRSMEITTLKQDVDNLNFAIQERDERISRYETSYREIIKLSYHLTKKRVAKAPSRLGNLVRRIRGKKGL
jgi:chromosome segregation ATPase